MDWQKVYQEKVMSAADAVDAVIKDGDHVALGGLAIATAPLNAMFAKIKAHKLKNIILGGNLITDSIPIDDPELTPDMIRYQAFFFGGFERKGYAQHNVTFVPMQFNNLRRYMLEVFQPDVAILQLTPPDENGYCCISTTGAGFQPSAVESAKKVIAQINRKLPWVCGHPEMYVHLNKINAIVEEDHDVPLFPMTPTSEIDQKIANYIIPEIPDGATIQLGLGGMANAIGYGLKDKKHLGVHSEMFTESMAYLHQLGVIDNSQKTFMPGVSVAGFTLGQPEQYEYCANNKLLYFAPYSFVNAVKNIQKNDNMISINNAITIDLGGQINSESIGWRHFSGTGGQVDFVRGAMNAKNGKSFICVSSTSKDKKTGEERSRIILDLPAGGVTSTLRSDVMYVCTEYGLVNLFGKDLPTRAKLLISIAHPQFRDQLEFDAKKCGIIY